MSDLSRYDDDLPTEDDDIAYEPFEDMIWSSGDDDLDVIDLDALDAIDLDEPDEPTGPDTTEPDQSTESAELPDPSAPSDPSESDQSSDSAESDEPDEPHQPEEPDQPDEPPAPDQPDEPDETGEPDALSKPAASNDLPGDLNEQDEPDEPTAPTEQTRPANQSPTITTSPARYVILLPLPDALAAEITDLRAQYHLAPEPPPGIILATLESTGEAVLHDALATWSAAHLPLRARTEEVVAEVIQAQQYLAAWSVQPTERLREARRALLLALGDHITLRDESPALFDVRVVIARHATPGQFPRLISDIQAAFEPVTWSIDDIQLWRATGPDSEPVWRPILPPAED